MPGAIRLAKSIAAGAEPRSHPVISQLIEVVRARLGAGHSLLEVLSRGVAYHHSSLPHEVRALIEDAVAEGVLNILVATTTMTEGVNLPVRSVVIASQGSYTRLGYEEFIRGPKLINAIGRAGRAAKETEGIVVLVVNGKITDQDFKRFAPDPEDMEVISNMATTGALEALAAFEDAVRASEDAIFELNEPVVSNFLSFIWHFAFELERHDRPLIDERLASYLTKTLAWLQLKQEDRARVFYIAQKVAGRYSKTDEATRKRWATSGTSLRSARALNEIASEVSRSSRGG